MKRVSLFVATALVLVMAASCGNNSSKKNESKTVEQSENCSECTKATCPEAAAACPECTEAKSECHEGGTCCKEQKSACHEGEEKACCKDKKNCKKAQGGECCKSKEQK